MPVLGHLGKLYLRREAPEPVVLLPGAVHFPSNSFNVNNQEYWSGDEVSLSALGGLPLQGEDTVGCPDGHGTYAGGKWLLGPNRDHIDSDQANFYVADQAFFYARKEEVGLLDIASFYIYRDQLDRISLYQTQDAALQGAKADRVPLARVDFSSLILAPWGHADYQNALLVCSQELDLSDYQNSDLQDEISLTSICDYAPTYQAPAAGTDDYNNADVYPRRDVNRPLDRHFWTVQGDLSEWSLNLTSQEVDTTALGERYGDSIKAVITGGGTLDFLVRRHHTVDGQNVIKQDSTLLMRLLLMAENGCKADAQFWMIDNQDAVCDLLPGSLFYSSRLMITSIAINTRATEYIAGSANFVTVGKIDLRAGTN